MNVVTRTVAYGVAMLATVSLACSANDHPRRPAADWHSPLQLADAALTSGDARTAQVAWEQAYRIAMRTRTPRGLIQVGEAFLRIGEVSRDRHTAVAQARRIFLEALVQARARRDALGAAAAATAFARLGDRDVAARGFEMALTIARQHGDIAAREQIAAQTRAAKTLEAGATGR